MRRIIISALIFFAKIFRICLTIGEKEGVNYKGAFEGNTNIESVVMSDSIKELYCMEFYGCKNLSTVSFSDSLETIGDYCFADCSKLTDVVLPEGIKYILIGAFGGCVEIHNIVFPDSVTDIEGGAFMGCIQLTEITIPRNASIDMGLRNSNIGISDYVSDNPFTNCSGLVKIEVDEENENYDSRDNCNAIICKDNNRLIAGCGSSIIPDGVKGIDNDAFDGMKIERLYVPASVEQIGGQCFEGAEINEIFVDENNEIYDSRDNCNAVIQKVWKWTERPSGNQHQINGLLVLGCAKTVIPDTVEEISYCAFKGRKDLKTISIPSSVKYIDMYAFAESGLQELILQDGIIRMGKYAFDRCSDLKKVIIPSSIDSSVPGGGIDHVPYLLSYDTFFGVDPDSIQVMECETVNYDSRNNCNAIILTESNELIVGCKNTIVPDGVKIISECAFYGTELLELKLPVGVEQIKYCAFGWCKKLDKLWIPPSVTDIDDNAFQWTDSVTIVTPKDSYAHQYAIAHNIPYINEDIWTDEDLKDDKKPDSSGNNTNPATGEKEKESEQKTDSNTGSTSKTTTDATTEVKTQETVQESTETDVVQDNPTTFNIKNKKTYKKSKKVVIKDEDGIKSVVLNSKKIKVKSGKKTVSFKLSSYKKSLKKKNKWNKIIVTDVNGNKKTIQFKVK